VGARNPCITIACLVVATFVLLSVCCSQKGDALASRTSFEIDSLSLLLLSLKRKFGKISLSAPSVPRVTTGWLSLSRLCPVVVGRRRYRKMEPAATVDQRQARRKERAQKKLDMSITKDLRSPTEVGARRTTSSPQHLSYIIHSSSTSPRHRRLRFGLLEVI